MNLGGRALFMMMATSWAPRGTVVQKRATAFTALSPASCRCPNLMSPPARQKHARPARLPCAGTSRPVSMQQICLAHKNQLSNPGPQSRFLTMQIFMTSNNDDGGGSSCDVNMEMRTSYNVPLLKKETTRLTLRTHKKIGKASTRLRAAEEQYDKLRVTMDASPTEELDEELLQRLEQAPNVEQFASELEELRARLKKLNWLEDQFGKSPLKSKKTLSVEDLQKLVPDGAQVVQYVEELEISDDESQKKKRVEADERNRRSKAEKAAKLKDENNVPQGGRLPYRRYYTEQKVEIRVGKQATDNDVLSLSPEHRSGSHWWYHASGCPGSHVVLCTDVASPSEADVLDAASLAALKSKCIGQSVIKVSMTRARNVSKPRGAKPGLVQLNGDVRTITLKKSDVEKRCKRLEQTVLVN